MKKWVEILVEKLDTRIQKKALYGLPRHLVWKMTRSRIWIRIAYLLPSTTILMSQADRISKDIYQSALPYIESKRNFTKKIQYPPTYF